MPKPKLTINWDELKTRRVDNRLREQGAMERNRAYAEMQENAMPAAPAPSGGILNNAIICMALFGLIGGVLAWGAQSLVVGPLTPSIGKFLDYNPSAERESENAVKEIQKINLKRALRTFTPEQEKSALEAVRQDMTGNPYFRLATDDKIKDEATRKNRLAHLEANDRDAVVWINAFSYGMCGMMIAMSLAVAEPLTQRKPKSTIISGFFGAVLGIVGGVAASSLDNPIGAFIASLTHDQSAMVRNLAQDSARWGTLGLFLGLGSGIVLRNPKKIMVGMAGGLLGGLAGGALFELLHGAWISRLVAMVAIGMVAGISTGLLENAVKSGWLKVTSGIIAGKQFILYRNPTYIGSSPDCQIYLFKDPGVGKRHAAIHLLGSGIEIENLPLGDATLVNGKSVQRAKLKNGDTVQISKTSFRFQEKRPASGK